MNFKVTDIKQYIYCPRIIYYLYVCPVKKKTTYKMDVGKAEHSTLDTLEKRRTLKRYNLEQGERIFHTYLRSDRLGLEGKLDMHIIANGRYFPVEYKFTERTASLNHKYQLVSYAMLLEDKYDCIVRYGLLYLVPRKEIIPVEITPNTRIFVKDILESIKRICYTEKMPGKPRHAAKCRDCEYRRFCRDV